MVISCPPQGSDTYRPGTRGAVAISTLTHGLSRRLKYRPEDATAHRMLGVAELHAGDCKAAAHHLAVAVKLLLAPATNECLQRSLHAHVELALVLPILITLCRRLERRATARRLLNMLLSRLVGE
jgi:hypothetical protein